MSENGKKFWVLILNSRRSCITSDTRLMLKNSSSHSGGGGFQGSFYDSPTPPKMVFANNKSCIGLERFITDTIMHCLRNGSLFIWGMVGSVFPPHLVMPITVEPSKPRMCHDEPFLNLWIKELPLKLDYISDLPR